MGKKEVWMKDKGTPNKMESRQILEEQAKNNRLIC